MAIIPTHHAVAKISMEPNNLLPLSEEISSSVASTESLDNAMQTTAAKLSVKATISKRVITSPRQKKPKIEAHIGAVLKIVF